MTPPVKPGEMRFEDETASEHIGNALQLLHNLRTYEMSSSQAVQHEETLNAITKRLDQALAKLKGDRRNR